MITSPVDGTVVARDVSVGQTVAASLQTPTLFSIAQNLGKMEVDINVGEPDIGNVKAGDSVSFSVLAYPNEVFHGTVSQVRINPQTLNNVVTYDVVVFADNTHGKLLPGMTANATHQRCERTERPNGSAGRAAHGHDGERRRGEASPAPRGARRSPPARPLDSTSIATERLFRSRSSVRLTNGTQAAVQPLQAGTLNAGDRVVIGLKNAQHNGKASGAAHPPMSASIGGSMRGIH